MKYPLVIGLGSHHGDDQFGWLVVDRLLAMGYPSERLACLKHPAALLDYTDAAAEVVICDACTGNGRIGAIRRLDWPTDEVMHQYSSGSHDLPLQEVMQLGKSLCRFPDQAQIWVVEGGAYGVNAPPSTEVCAAANHVAGSIWREHCHA